MDAVELSILEVFGRYLVGPTEMLFCSAQDCRMADRRFHAAMLRLVQKGLLVKERPRQAYSLTKAGYRLTRSCHAAPPRGRTASLKTARGAAASRARRPRCESAIGVVSGGRCDGRVT